MPTLHRTDGLTPMQVVLRQASVGLRAARDVRRRIAERSEGRPLVIDMVIGRIHGWRVGDLVVGFEPRRPILQYVEVQPIGDVPVVIDRRLVDLLRGGAVLRYRRFFGAEGFSVHLRHPEDWLDLLDGRRPAPR